MDCNPLYVNPTIPERKEIENKKSIQVISFGTTEPENMTSHKITIESPSANPIPSPSRFQCSRIIEQKSKLVRRSIWTVSDSVQMVFWIIYKKKKRNIICYYRFHCQSISICKEVETDYGRHYILILLTWKCSAYVNLNQSISIKPKLILIIESLQAEQDFFLQNGTVWAIFRINIE